MYGKHPFFMSARDLQDERYDRDFNGKRVDARRDAPMARLKPLPERASTDPRKD
jgi:hypothetical protein